MNVPWTSEEMWLHLQEQLLMLEDSSKLYDEGKYYQAKNIANIISTLFHNGRGSTSLMTQMGLDVKMLDTAGERRAGMLNNFLGLVAQRLTADGDFSSATYEALLDNLPPHKKSKFIPLSEWLKKVVLVDGKEEFSRERLISSIRNKHGGSHIDPRPQENVKMISRKELSQMNPVIDDVQHRYKNRADLASVRQMGYEVLATLKP